MADRYRGLDLPIRSQVEAVERRGRTWSFAKTSNEVVWQAGSLVKSMTQVLQRRVVLASISGEAHFVDRGRVFAGLGDIDAFVLGQTDDELLERWFRACLLLQAPEAASFAPTQTQGPMPYAAYGLPKLAFAPGPIRQQAVPVTPRILRLMAVGRTREAMQAAGRRLRASGLMPTTLEAHADAQRMRRCAAALLFPISNQDSDRLAGRYLRPHTDTPTDIPSAHQPTETA